MGNLVAYAQRWGNAALDVLLPPQCLICDAAVGAQGGLCAGCFNGMRLIGDPCCRRCGVPLEPAAPLARNAVCPRCEEEPPPWGRGRAALEYDAQSKRLLLPLKHADRPELARALGVMMARAGANLLAETDLLVPVPLHPSRLRVRGYNQAALLAQAVGRHARVAVVVDALVRVKVTPALGELSAARRQAAVSGAIGIRRGRDVAGKRVLLVDDVLTSGATCSACTWALLAAGASSVDVLVAARVPDPRLR